jgi:glucose-6-phosphate isomerase
MQVNQLKSWTALQRDTERLSEVRTETLFEQEPARLSYLSLEAAGVYADFSKNKIDNAALRNLMALAEQRKMSSAIRAMFIGEPVNSTENRPALHTLLRAKSTEGSDTVQLERIEQVRAVKSRMLSLAERVRNGDYRGHGGAVIRDVVNIGIGGINSAEDTLTSEDLKCRSDKYHSRCIEGISRPYMLQV